uniref:Uncharacterized protein n=1 Tax=Anguilla anguilla TaxID=7936 RepID=A0A0E9TUL8_ANGAN
MMSSWQAESSLGNACPIACCPAGLMVPSWYWLGSGSCNSP